MSETKYEIILNDNVMADNITLDFALILVKGVFEHYYNEHHMCITIKEMEGQN